MNTVASARPPQAAAGAGLTEAYARLDFSFPTLEGLSQQAVKTHLELYAGYVKEANEIAAVLANPATYSGSNEAVHARESLSRRLAFELGGVRLHELFFAQMNPGRVATPGGVGFMSCLDRCFGDFNIWVEDIKQLAKTRGPGWVATYWDVRARRLNNMWIDLHHLAVPAGQQLVFVLDLWEHAYWDDYGAKGRPRYITDMLRQTDWAVVDQRMNSGTA